MSDQAPELLPCPFCGGKAYKAFNSMTGEKTMAVCSSCGATAFDRKWNRRAPVTRLIEEAVQAERERIAYEIAELYENGADEDDWCLGAKLRRAVTAAIRATKEPT
jgi:NMD protein affecting ribosome stability and mRNA decay